MRFTTILLSLSAVTALAAPVPDAALSQVLSDLAPPVLACSAKQLLAPVHATCVNWLMICDTTGRSTHRGAWPRRRFRRRCQRRIQGQRKSPTRHDQMGQGQQASCRRWFCKCFLLSLVPCVTDRRVCRGRRERCGSVLLTCV